MSKCIVIKSLIFIVLLVLHYVLSMALGVPFKLWGEVQLINVFAYTLLWILLLLAAKLSPHYIGFTFMIGFLLIVFLFKFLVDFPLKEFEIESKAMLIVVFSFFIYLIFTIVLLIQMIKNIKFSSKKE